MRPTITAQLRRDRPTQWRVMNTRSTRQGVWTITTIAMIVMVSCTTTTSQQRIGNLQPSARRSEWRQQLHWPQPCEQAFAQTREQRGAQSGVRVMRLSSGWRVVEVRCAAGAYQPSQMFVGISPTGIASPPISMPTVTFDDEGRAKWSTSEEVWGTVTFGAEANQVTIVNVARGLGDCGSMIVYRIDTDGVISFKVATARGKPCDDNSQAPTSWPVLGVTP
jgi:uncharacterized protein DUF1176